LSPDDIVTQWTRSGGEADLNVVGKSTSSPDSSNYFQWVTPNRSEDFVARGPGILPAHEDHPQTGRSMRNHETDCQSSDPFLNDGFL